MIDKTLELSTLSQQSRGGCWTLGPGHALTLSPRQAGMVHLRRGRLWVTLDGPHRMGGRASGDLVLHPGDSLRLLPGQRAVLEDWPGPGVETSALDWRTTPADAQVTPSPNPWSLAVASSWMNAVAALGLWMGAWGRRITGIPALFRRAEG